MDVAVSYRGQKHSTMKLDKATTIGQVIGKLKLNGQTFIIKLNGKVAHGRTVLKSGDKLEFVGVIYGG